MTVLDRLQRANPVVDSDRLLSTQGAMDDFLLAVKERSGIVHATEDRPPIEVETPTGHSERSSRRRRLVPMLAAAVAIAAITLVVAINAVGNDGGNEAAGQTTPIATTTPDEGTSATTPSTVAPDPGTPDPVQIAEALLEAFTVADGDTLGELFTADPAFDDRLGLIETVADYAPLFDWYRALDWEFASGSCTETEGETVVLCNYTERTALGRGLGLEPAPGSLALHVRDGRIERLEYAHSPIQGWWEFRAWVEQTHPDDIETMYERDTKPRLTAASTALWDRHVYEWMVGLAGPGPISSFDVIAGTTFVPIDPGVTSAFHFFEDGRWYVGYSPEFVAQVPAGIGTVRFEGSTAYITNVRGACEGPTEASYEIHLLENGNLNLVAIEDRCLFRANFFPGEWKPVF